MGFEMNETKYPEYILNIPNLILMIPVCLNLIFRTHVPVCVLIAVQAVLIVIIRPIAANIYSKLYRKRRDLFAAELEPRFVTWRGIYFGMGVCRTCLLIFASVVPVCISLWLDEDSLVNDIMGIILAGIVLPLAWSGVITLLRLGLKPWQKIFVRLRKMSLEHLQREKIWIIVDQADGSFRSQAYDFIPSEGLSYPVYLIARDELHHITPKKINEQELSEKLHRCCYLVRVTTEEELKQIFDKIYMEYLGYENDGLQKIVIVNLRSLSTQEHLFYPKEYLNQEFIYYAELDHIGDLTYQFLSKTCGDQTDNFSFRVSKKRHRNVSQQKRERNIEWQKLDFDQTQLRYFEHPDLLRQRIHESVIYEEGNNIKNRWLLSFYNSACVFQNPARSVMALLDYWELLLRLLSIYYFRITEKPSISETEMVHASLMAMGRFLQEASAIHPERHKILKEKLFEVPEVIQVYLDKLEDYVYIHFKGKNVSFLGLISLMQILRNKIIAHGILNDENASIVWGITFWATDLLNLYLQLSDFQLNEAGSTYEIGFETTVRADRFIVNRGGYPCIAAIQKSNKKSYIYVNFFNGELITPEFVEVDPA